jgi:ethanolamine utilization cobalamin adenosyltransferase
MVVVNGPETMGSPEGEITILDHDSHVNLRGTKEELAAAVWNRILACSGSFGW